jgi:molecular chaperone DnaK (HSP70)
MGAQGIIVKLGIDFGTTHTVVACVDRGNYPIVSFFDGAGDAHDFFPSVVAERAGELRFGFDAIARTPDPSWTVVRSFKRLLSGWCASPQDAVTIGATTMPVVELVTEFLLALKRALFERSNQRRVGDEVRSVVAVPANASGLARFVTLDAFRGAGFAPVAMLNEPSAAGFEYTHRHRDTLTSKRELVVVYDLGGGTFDASLVRMRGASHAVLATAGKNQLGGDDFDEELVKLVLDAAELSASALEPRALERLRVQCRDAKEALTPNTRKISIDLDAALGASAPKSEVVVQTSAFYEAAKPLVQASIEVMLPVMTRLERATSEEVDSALAEVAGIYVVGGASELPIVPRALRERFGRRVHRSPYPSAAIAIGLAIACDDVAGFELSDHFSRTFGVFREGRSGAEITFDPIFTHATILPARSGEPLRYRRTYRAAHNVGHYRFVECSAIDEQGRPRGDMMLSGDVFFPFDPTLHGGANLADVPVRRLEGGGPRVEEEYALDEHGLVAVTIRDLDSGFTREHRLGATG